MPETKSFVPDIGKKKFTLFAGLMVAMFLSALDQTVFGTALPTIVGELRGIEHMLWVTTAYLLAMTIMLPVYGKLGDILGHKKLFIAAIALFVAGSVIGGVADNMSWLIVGRAIQGAGGGGLMIQAMSIITVLISARERAKYSWIFAVVFTVPSVIGPILGGWLTTGPGWRWVFWINLPLGLLALGAAFALIPRLPMNEVAKKIDMYGIALLALTSTSIVLATSLGGITYAWDSAQIIGLFSFGVLCAMLFVFVERQQSEPIMPRMLFVNRNFVVVLVAGLILGVVMMGTLVYIPTYLQMVTGSTATESGYLMMPMIIAMLVMSTLVGQIISRTGRYKWAPLTGMAVVSASLLLLSTMSPSMSIWQICAYLAVLGVGIGLSMQVLMLIVQNEFAVEYAGTAIATNTYFRTMGMSLGAAVVGTLFVSKLTGLLSAAETSGQTNTYGDARSITPDKVRELPDEIRNIIVNAYNDALTPVFKMIIPLTLVAFVILFLLKEKPFSSNTAGMQVVK